MRTIFAGAATNSGLSLDARAAAGGSISSFCVAYRHKGQRLASVPCDVETLAEVEPEYKTLPGWQKPTPGIRDVKELPAAAREYLNFISNELDAEIGMISTGPERDATIVPRGTKLASWL